MAHSTKNLAKYAATGAGVFVVLPNKYLAAFDELLAQPSFNKVFNIYQSNYISRKHSGVGVLRQRLKFVLNHAQNKSDAVSPTLFRSGLSNYDEIIGMRHTTDVRADTFANVFSPNARELVQLEMRM